MIIGFFVCVYLFISRQWLATRKDDLLSLRSNLSPRSFVVCPILMATIFSRNALFTYSRQGPSMFLSFTTRSIDPSIYPPLLVLPSVSSFFFLRRCCIALAQSWRQDGVDWIENRSKIKSIPIERHACICHCMNERKEPREQHAHYPSNPSIPFLVPVCFFFWCISK